MNEDNNTMTLKVSGQTAPHALKTATAGYLKNGKTVYLDCIGVMPNYVAVKVIIMLRGLLSTMGKTLNADPIFHDISLDGPTIGVSEKTGIRWILKQREN